MEHKHTSSISRVAGIFRMIRTFRFLFF